MEQFPVRVLQEVFSAGFSWRVAVAVAYVMWFVVYFFIIRENYRTKSCGMPILGICSILVGCLIYSSFGPYWRPDLFPHNPYFGGTFGVVWVWRTCLALQTVVLYQFFKYHDPKKHRYDLELNRVSAKTLVVIVLAFNLVAQWAFITYYHDINVNVVTPVGYLFLAVGFVMLALNRPGHEGLSYPAAWLKAVGIAVIYLSSFIHPLDGYGTLLAQPDVQNQTEMCPDPGVNPHAPCEIMEILCPTSPVVNGAAPPSGNALVTIDYDRCEPKGARGARAGGGDFAAWLLAKRPELEKRGWRITDKDAVFNTFHGGFTVFNTKRPLPPTVNQDPASWGAIWYCMTHAPEPLESPVWQVEALGSSVFSCMDGEIRMSYEFPVIIAASCVGFDALYVYILWRGRRQRRAEAMAHA